MKALIAQLARRNPRIEANIFRSCHDVNLKTVIGYVQDGVCHPYDEALSAGAERLTPEWDGSQADAGAED